MLLLLLTSLACKDKGDDSAAADPDAREACAISEPERQLFWGDLHAHTSYSFDAWVYDVRLDPEDATRFAMGEAVLLPPLGADGQGTVEARLDRPLDFVAITDHAEYLGEIEACTTPGSGAYDGEFCADYRDADASSIQSFGTVLALEDPHRIEEICEEVDCGALAAGVWQRVQRAAEDYYDRSSACGFTTFVGYEWTGATGVSNYHRNVIFRGAVVPEVPVSYFEAPTAGELWDALEDQCLDAGEGCDALAIPHNPNMSNGQQFYPDFESADDAERRLAMEPLLEIFQHKGESECMDGLSGILGAPDEHCGFEKLRGATLEDDCGDEPGSGAMANLGCVHRLDFARGILLEGLLEEQRLGINPYRLGLVASTDTHSGTPGLVAEDGWPGHLGSVEGTAEGRLQYPGLNPGGVVNNPGGLTAIWAEENSRGALFEAMRRREVYGTSGPRIGARFFGGRGLPADLCEREDLVGVGYELGVPMGGVLPGGDGPPSFAASAWRDPEGGPLQRLQVVKGWIDGDGQRNQAVYDVAGGDGGEGVDLETCQRTGDGHEALCAVWTDPDYDPDQPAFYYLRVLETPSCRWSTRDCGGLDEAERPESCDDPEIQQLIQERAWTSPIFTGP